MLTKPALFVLAIAGVATAIAFVADDAAAWQAPTLKAYKGSSSSHTTVCYDLKDSATGTNPVLYFTDVSTGTTTSYGQQYHTGTPEPLACFIQLDASHCYVASGDGDGAGTGQPSSPDSNQVCGIAGPPSAGIGAPTVTATAIDSDTVRLSWTNPSFDFATNKWSTLAIERNGDTQSPVRLFNYPGSPTTLDVDAAPGTQTCFQVRLTHEGFTTGSQSPQACATTPGTANTNPPSPPRNLNVQMTNDGVNRRVTATWTEPLDQGGAPIEWYWIYPDNGCCSPGANGGGIQLFAWERTFTFAVQAHWELSPGQTYTWHIVAENDYGFSQPASTTAQYPTAVTTTTTTSTTTTATTTQPPVGSGGAQPTSDGLGRGATSATILAGGGLVGLMGMRNASRPAIIAGIAVMAAGAATYLAWSTIPWEWLAS